MDPTSQASGWKSGVQADKGAGSILASGRRTTGKAVASSTISDGGMEMNVGEVGEEVVLVECAGVESTLPESTPATGASTEVLGILGW